MPAKSEKQRRFMGMVLAAKRGKLKNPSKAVKDAAEGISEKDAKDFAKKPIEKAAAYVDAQLQKRASCGKSHGTRAKNREKIASQYKKRLQKQAKGGVVGAVTQVSDTVDDAIDVVKQTGNVASTVGDAVKSAAKGTAAGAGIGALAGSSLGAALTWALMKDPKAKDYLMNSAMGGAAGGALGAPAGLYSALVRKQAAELPPLQKQAKGGIFAADDFKDEQEPAKPKPQQDYKAGMMTKDVQEQIDPAVKSVGAIDNRTVLMNKGIQDISGKVGNLDARAQEIIKAIKGLQVGATNPEVVKAAVPGPVGAGAAGAGAGLLLTRLLAKDPSLVDYLVGGGIGAGLGAAASVGSKAYAGNLAEKFNRAMMPKVGSQSPEVPENVYKLIDDAVELMAKEAADPSRAVRAGSKLLGLFGKTPAQKAMGLGGAAVGAGAGTLHYKSQPEGKKSLVAPIITGAGTAWTLNPRYISRIGKNVRHALKTEGADPQLPVIKALLTSAMFTGGAKGYESINSVLQDLKASGKSLAETTKALEVDPSKGGANINEITGAAVEAMKGMAPTKDAQGNIISTPAQQFGKSLSKGLVSNVRETAADVGDWAKANKGKLIGGAAGAAGLYTLYKIMAAKAERKRKEEEAKMQAQLIAKAMRTAR